MPNHTLNDTHLGSQSIFLQSSKATSKINDAHASFFLNQVITTPADTQFLIGLTSAEIPYSWYNIDIDNNKLLIETRTTNPNINSSKLLTVEYPIELNPQNYNSSSITKEIQRQLTAGQAPVIIDFDDDTNKFTFKHTDISDLVNNTVKIISTTMNNELGFPNQHLPTERSNSIESINVLNLSGTSSVYVNLLNISVDNLDSRGDYNGVLAKLNVTSAPSEYLYYSQVEHQYYPITNRNIDMFEVSLTDDNGELLKLNGLDFSISLTIHYSKLRTPFIENRNLLEGHEDDENK